MRDSGDTKDIVELNDLNLNTKLAISELPVVFTFATDAKYGVYKVILYAESNTTSIAGFKVKVGTTLCNDTVTSGVDKAEMLCVDNLGDKTLTVEHDGAGDATDLAEVVIAGQSWTKFKCMPGWFSESGNHTEDDKDCAECADGSFMRDWGFAGTACTSCKIDDNNVLYSNTPEHRKTACAECAAPKVANDANDGCEECKPGKGYVIAGTKVSCVDCEAGKYRDGACPDGVVCPCLDCVDGWTQNLVGKTSCTKCLAGTMGADKTSVCASAYCNSGEYQNLDEQVVCKECPAGTFSPSSTTEGFDSCTDCTKGTYQEAVKSTSCTDAGPGYYVDTDKAIAKIPCPKGSYSDGTKDTVCTQCAVGHYQDAEAQDACEEAGPGYYAEAVGLVDAKECPVGQFSNGSANTECMICPPGTYQSQPAQSKCIVCALGTYNDLPEQAACKDCQAPFIANTTSQTECYFCPLGMNWTDSSRCDDCVAGKHNNIPESGFCKNCDAHYSSSEGSIECEPCMFDQYSDPASATCSNFTKDENEQAKDCDTTHITYEQRCKDAQLPGCNRDMLESAYGDFYWPFVLVGEETEIECTFDKGLFAVRSCKLDKDAKEETGVWADPEYGCKTSKSTAGIDNILDDNENATTLEIAKALSGLTSNTKNIGRGDIKAVGTVISSLISNTSNVDTQVIESVIGSVSNLLGGDLKGSGETAEMRDSNTKLVNTLKTITKLAPPDVIIKSPRLAIVKVTAVKAGGISFNAPANGNLSGVGMGEASKDTVPILVIEAGDQAGTALNMDIAVVLLADSSLLPDSSTERADKALEDGPDELLKSISKGGNGTSENVTFVNSMVTEIEVEFKGEKPVDFKLDLMLRPSTPMGNFSQRKSVDSTGKTIAFAYECASYNPEKNTWIKDCDTVSDPDAPEKGVLCNCRHNTSFAVLMSAFEIDKAYAESQTILTQVLLGLSTVGLIITLALMLPPKNLRSTRSAKINICFSIALLLASVVFLIQDLFIDGKNNTGVIKIGSIGCAIYTMLQHYLWLVVFMWMGVEGFLMYLSLVQVFGSHISKYMLKFNLFAWGLPLPLPFIGYFVFSKTTTVGDVSVTTNSYLADSMCFIRPESIPFFTLFLAPLIITILVNIVFFALVCKVIKSSKSSGTVSDTEQLLRQVKAAVGVMVLLGTGWFFGIFMSIPGSMEAQLIMQYVFILLNSSQGVFVFIFYVVLNDQVKNHWMVKFGIKQEAATSNSKVTPGKSGTQTTGAASSGENIYANAAATEEDHTYANADEAGKGNKGCEFPAKSEENCNI